MKGYNAMWQSIWNRFRASRLSAWPFLLTASIVFLAIVSLVVLSSEVLEGDTLGFDHFMLTLFRHADDPATPLGPAWVQLALTEVTALGGHTVLILFSLLAAGFCVAVRRYDSLFFLVLSAAGAVLLNSGLKHLFGRARPDIVEHLVDVSTYSYPSGHALLSSALYLSFAFLLAEMATRWSARVYIIVCGFLLAGIIGFSRLYLGVHYPTDIVAGWVVGAAWAMTCWLVLRHVLPSPPRGA